MVKIHKAVANRADRESDLDYNICLSARGLVGQCVFAFERAQSAKSLIQKRERKKEMKHET
jgi:hypothetical protein